MTANRNQNTPPVRCPKCKEGFTTESSRLESSIGPAFRKRRPRLLIARCLNCGAEYDSSTPEFYLTFADMFASSDEGVIIKNGLKGELNGVEYEINGYTVFTLQEYPEGPYIIEWQASTKDGENVIFTEESGTVRLYRFINNTDNRLSTDQNTLTFEDRQIQKKQARTGTLNRNTTNPLKTPARGVAGRNKNVGNHHLRPGVEVGTANRFAPGQNISIYSFKKDGIPYRVWETEKNLSAARGEKISYVEFMKAFREEDFRNEYGYTIKKRRTFRRKAAVYAAGAAAALVFMIYGLFYGSEVEGVTNIAKPAGEIEAADNDGLHISRTLYGPFRIHKPDSLYRLEVSADEADPPPGRVPPAFRVFLIEEKNLRKHTDDPDNTEELSSLFNEIEALEDPLESYMFSGDFNCGRFYAGGKRRHQWQFQYSHLFFLNKPARYYIMLETFHTYTHPSKTPAGGVAGRNKNVGNSHLRPGVGLSTAFGNRYFTAAFIVLALLALINRKKSLTYSELPFPVKGKIKEDIL